MSTNELIKFDPSAYRAGLRNIVQTAPPRMSFLKMNKGGVWVHGAEEEPVSPSAAIYVDPEGIVQGWQCWRDTSEGGAAELLGERLVPMTQGPLPPCPDVVPQGGREWAQLLGLSLLVDGMPMKYSTTSRGGLSAVSCLAADIMDATAPDATRPPIAMIRLGNDWYKHKEGFKVYVPIFEVIKYVDQLPGRQVSAEAPAAEPPKTVKKTRKTAAQPT